tara:strand:+ start:251 stop:523 length:273 start_codon:yes stop_codon:yes gene_type:complete
MFWNFLASCAPYSKVQEKKTLKSDQNVFSDATKKKSKKKALKCDQNVFGTFCSLPYPPREYVKFLTVKSDATFFQNFSFTFYYLKISKYF